MKSKFESHVKKNILEIERNQYIHPNDPLYIVKLMRYNNKSADFHYTLGQEHEKEGRHTRALFHYIEATRVSSPYYYKARSSLIDLEKKMLEKSSLTIFEPVENVPPPQEGSSSTKIIMFLLAISNLSFIVLLLLIAISEW